MKWTRALWSSLAAVAVHAADSDAPVDISKVKLPTVPAALDVGQSGFPEMPTVASLLSASTKSLETLDLRTAKLQKKLKTLQEENSLRLQHQKAVFEKKLKEQEESNLEIVKSNAEVAKSIMKLQSENNALLTGSQALQKGNALRSREFKLLEQDLRASQSFVKEAISATDDSDAKDLEILNEEDKPEDKALSFLSIEAEADTAEEAVAETKPADASVKDLEESPESLLTLLGTGVKEVEQQGKDSEANLKQLFMTHFQAGVKRHKALLAQQDMLNSTKKALTEYQEKLLVAKKHLQSTQTGMDSQLKSSGRLLQKVGKAALLKPEEAVTSFSSMSSDSAKEGQ